MSLPTVQFLLDDGTGTFPYDVTAYARLIDGFSFTRGREDEQAAVTAGSLSFALNNADGRFTPGSTVIDSPSPIKVDQRIRLKETVNGVTYTRFTGYVKSWRVGWPAGVDTHSVVQVTATDAQARAERRALLSVVQEEILSDSPATYYTLGEPEGSTSAADSSGNQAPPLTMAGDGADVVFGSAIGPGTDGLTAAEFAGGKHLSGTLPAAPAMIGFAFATIGTSMILVTDGTLNGSGGKPLGLTIDASGQVRVSETGAVVGSAINDGEVHTAAWSLNQVVLDGVTYTPAIDAPSAATLHVGGTVGANFANFTGSIAHVAVYSPAISTTRAASHSSAMLTGFAGESGTDRITRLAGYANIPVGTLDTSLTNVPHKDITGTSAWSAIAEVTDAEGGLSLIDGSGDLGFTNRNAAPEKVTPDLTLVSSLVSFDAAPTDDDAEILNHVETTAEATGVVQVARDAASEGTHGRYPESKTYLVTTDAEALDRANWLVSVNAEPTTRFGTLTVNLYKMTAAQQSAALAALEPGAWLRVTGMPAQTPGGTTVDVMVQGFAEEQTGSSWSLTCNVVARAKFTAWVLDDTTYGVLDSTTKLYV